MKKLQVFISASEQHCSNCHGLVLTWQGRWRCALFNEIMHEQDVEHHKVKRLNICIANEQN